jgi:hypothetical protein
MDSCVRSFRPGRGITPPHPLASGTHPQGDGTSRGRATQAIEFGSILAGS